MAGEREPGTIRASNAAQAALMPNAHARFVPGAGHAWLAVHPALHVRMVEAWIAGQELPAELLPETNERSLLHRHRDLALRGYGQNFCQDA